MPTEQTFDPAVLELEGFDAPETPQAPEAPEAPEVPQAPEVPETPQPPSQPPAQPPPQAPPLAQAQPSAPPPASDEEVRRQIAEARERIRKAIEERYVIPSEEESALLTSPGAVLPKLVSRLFLDVYDAVFANVVSQLPALVAPVIDRREQARRYREEFFRAWPQLNKPEYTETVERIARAYRQANPNAPPDKAIREIGAQAIVALGIDAKPSTGASSASFKPAATGSAASKPQPQKQTNIWAELAQEFLEER